MNKPRNNSSEEPIMNAPYLWDGSGEPDPEVQRLESLLAQFSHREIPLALPLPRGLLLFFLLPLLRVSRNGDQNLVITNRQRDGIV